MKNILPFILLFLCLSAYSQNRKKDTLSSGMPDCTESYKNDSIYFKKITDEGKKTDYKELNKLIIEHLIPENIPSKDLVIYLSEKVVALICPEGSDWCASGINVKNPNYNESHFWTPQTLKIFNQHFNKNIIPKKIEIGGSYALQYIDKEHPFTNESTQEYILRQDTGEYLQKKYHVIHDKDYTPVNLALSNSILMNFFNYLDQKVMIIIKYNHVGNRGKEQRMTFQYTNKKWNLISHEAFDLN